MAAATAIMEIVFMFRLSQTGGLVADHARRIREHNLIKINLIFLRWSAATVSHDSDRLTLA
jgi:hypothetical protein